MQARKRTRKIRKCQKGFWKTVNYAMKNTQQSFKRNIILAIANEAGELLMQDTQPTP